MEARDGRETAAGPDCPVAEERPVITGRAVGDDDRLVRDTRVLQDEPVRFPAVEQPASGRVRSHHGVDTRTEASARRVDHVFTHLIALHWDRRAKRRQDPGRVGAERLHRGDRGLRHPGDGAAPARMDARERVHVRLVQNDRDTVRDHHDEAHIGVGCHQCVRPGDGIRVGPGTPAAVGDSDPHDATTVGLPAEN
jgi:hypothetical protein